MPRTTMTVRIPVGDRLPAALVASGGEGDSANNMQARPTGLDFLIGTTTSGTPNLNAKSAGDGPFLRKSNPDDLALAQAVGVHSIVGAIPEMGGFVDPTSGYVNVNTPAGVLAIYVGLGGLSFGGRSRRLSTAAPGAARVTIPQTRIPQWWLGIDPIGRTLAFVNADVANGHRYLASGYDLIVARSVAITATVTVVGQPTGPLNRAGDAAYSIVAANGIHLLGPFGPDGWMDSGGYVNVNVSHADARLAVVPVSPL